MAGSSTKIAFLFLVTFAFTIPCLEAGLVFDDFLKAQADAARKLALSAYIPIPRAHHYHAPGHDHGPEHAYVPLFHYYYMFDIKVDCMFDNVALMYFKI